MPTRVLIADDQPDVLSALRLLLKVEGYETHTVQSPSAALAAAEQGRFDVVLIDLNYARDTTSGHEGMDLLTRLSRMDPRLPVVVMTAWGTVEIAVEAMRRGARDFITKPWDNQRLVTIVRTQVELRRALDSEHRLAAENRALRDASSSALGSVLLARSAAMMRLMELIQKFAQSDASVLITGENGTGKTLAAKVLHTNSPRANHPLLVVNAGGLSPTVFESELFGHVKGAFTDARQDRLGRFDLADGGTLLLDEIANIPLEQQSKLLRVLEMGEFEPVGSSQTRKVDVRVISATNADLRTDVADGKFRQDLLFRLNTVEIHLPPLRERREDIPLLAEHFLHHHAAKYRKPMRRLASAALNELAGYRWPGNVRELDHVIERAVLLADEDIVSAADLSLGQFNVPVSETADSDAIAALDDVSIDEIERRLILRAMDRFGNNVVKAAKALGLSRSGLYRRLDKHGLLRGAGPAH